MLDYPYRVSTPRANGRWVEAQQWALPAVHEMALPAVRRLAERYREVVIKDLREGRIAVQVGVGRRRC